MVERLLGHPVVRGCTEFVTALVTYVAAIFLAYVLIGQLAKVAL